MEQQADYTTETKEALEMLNYKEPSVVIERPRKIAERQPGGEFVERTIPVYVKFSTEFKAELKNITGSELKVWTYLILSINEDGIAFPGIRTIADAIDMSHQTVITAIEGLEKKNLLRVVRGEKRYNLYQPAEEYVGIFDKDPMSQKIGTVKKTEQRKSQVLSADESNGFDLNKTLNKKEEATKTQSIFTLYEHEIGLLTPIIADAIEDAEKTFGTKWVSDAITESAKNNKRNWKYVEAILKRWKAQGNQEAMKPAYTPRQFQSAQLQGSHKL